MPYTTDLPMPGLWYPNAPMNYYSDDLLVSSSSKAFSGGDFDKGVRGVAGVLTTPSLCMVRTHAAPAYAPGARLGKPLRCVCASCVIAPLPAPSGLLHPGCCWR